MRTVYFPNFTFEPFTEEKTWTAKSYVDEDAGQYYIQLEVPGLSRSDLKIKVEDRELHIEGERKGRFPVTFRKAFTLPDEVDTDKIKAQTKDGILELVLPKMAALAPKEIAVEEAKESFFVTDKK
jgi:HSP20 family protein